MFFFFNEIIKLMSDLGNGYITTKTLREILAAIDDKLTQEDLDGMIEEIDSEGTGKVDVEGTDFNEMTYLYKMMLTVEW